MNTNMEAITNRFNRLFRPHAKHHDRTTRSDLPVYEPLREDSGDSTPTSPSRTSSSTEITLHRPQTTNNPGFSSSSETLASLGGPDIMAMPPSAPHHTSSSKFTLKLPPLKIFLSDFTLGFADGLTVPFALTAGLSSLGQTNTVIYAGMAEICAGSISMGIGGYLAAKGERREQDSDSPDDDENPNDENEKLPLHKPEDPDMEENHPLTHTIEDPTRLKKRLTHYLTPLNLPPHLQEQILSHARQSPYNPLESIPTQSTIQQPTTQPPSPILSGLSIAIGYLLGGILPLFPYFFVSSVTDGLAWSFAVCVVALFTFGFGKAFLLSRRRDDDGAHSNSSDKNRRGGAKWKTVRNSLWEGIQMVVLGSVAAIAAVVCVRAFEGFV